MPNSSRFPEALQLTLALVLCLASPAVLAQSSSTDGAADEAVREAIRAFESAEFRAARDALAKVVETPDLAPAVRQEALSYLAASEHALGDLVATRRVLRTLYLDHPEAKLDPGIFLPELVSLSSDVRIEVERERALFQPSVATTLPEPSPLALSLLPFGTGQFVNQQVPKGIAFLAGQALLFGASTLMYAQFSGLKVDDSGPLQGGQFRDVGTARALQWGYFATFWAGMAVNVGGVIDALVQRQHLSAANLAAQQPRPFPTVAERRP